MDHFSSVTTGSQWSIVDVWKQHTLFVNQVDTKSNKFYLHIRMPSSLPSFNIEPIQPTQLMQSIL